MDGQRFDQITRVLARGLTRRATAAVLAGLGAALARSAPESTARRKGDEPRKKRVCLCSAAGCQSKKVKDRSKVIRRNAPCAYKGKCTGLNPCAAAPLPKTPSSTAPSPTAPSPTICTALREACSSSGECCSGTAACEDNFCEDAPPEVCCQPIGVACGDHCDCCGADARCLRSTGGDGEDVCCQLDLGPCIDDSDCCDPLACSGGVCVQ
jgi:hypothetical protein